MLYLKRPNEYQHNLKLRNRNLMRIMKFRMEVASVHKNLHYLRYEIYYEKDNFGLKLCLDKTSDEKKTYSIREKFLSKPLICN